MTVNPYKSPRADVEVPPGVGKPRPPSVPVAIWFVTGLICLIMPNACMHYFGPRIIGGVFRHDNWTTEHHAMFMATLFLYAAALAQFVAVACRSRIAGLWAEGFHLIGLGGGALWIVLAIALSVSTGPFAWKLLVAGAALVALYGWAWWSMRRWRKRLTPPA